MECSATVSSQNRVRSSSRSPCRSASPRVTASPFPQGWNYSGVILERSTFRHEHLRREKHQPLSEGNLGPPSVLEVPFPLRESVAVRGPSLPSDTTPGSE